MKISQISIFLENKKGRLLEVCDILGKAKINILALTIADTKDFGVLRILVDKPADAIEVLKNNKFTADLTDIIAVELENKPGKLAHILEVLEKNNINLEYMYGFNENNSEEALMVFRFEDTDKAIKVLKSNKIKIVSGLEITSI